MNARKAHNTGRNHIANVRDYFASLNHDKAQNIIDQIIQSHETGGGRNQMMMAPSMRLGAGFMNPMTTQPGGQGGPPFPPQNQSFNHNGPPNGGGPAPPFRPPFPPQHQNGGFPPNNMGTPPFPPPGVGAGVNGNGTPPSFPPGFPGAGAGAGPNGLPFRPPPISIQNSPAPPTGGLASAPPPAFTQAAAPPAGAGGGGGAAPGIHPDRLRMMGNR
ncbi:U1 small nuclear ribonucleoprotein C [Kwoniella heveanensis BCC8398]|uniref:U1 small nuclear ribonucleoprotein C n=1 Tax=Kwoniella heveanensis BCC8398 TaxID=1296120 RepID=A0A1B9GLN4_9TREE|nr:U1 small nuclear ribonucleoprotein C [Kwoniella heveanensis BCC8398]